MRLPLAATLLLTACTVYNRNDWFTQRNDAMCDLHVNCFGTYGDHGACEAAQEGFDEPPCEDFRPTRADGCVKQLREHSRNCPTNDINEWRIPGTCSEVCKPVAFDSGP